MLIDCEKGCTKYAWHLGGHCPESWANDDGGFWCWERCGNKRPEEVKAKAEPVDWYTDINNAMFEKWR